MPGLRDRAAIMGFRRFLYTVTVTMLVLGAGVWLGLVHWGFLVLVPLVSIAIVFVGASRIDSGFFLPAVTSYPCPEKKIALTFDDGPDLDFTLAVASLVERYGGRATFFCIGHRVERQPDLIRQVHERGHQVGNHSYSHGKWIDFKSKQGWLQEIRRTDAALALATNMQPPTLFRPPYGVTTPHLAAALRETGHTVVGWRVRPFDTAVQNPTQIVQRILARVKPGDIILLHDTHAHILPALEQLLPTLIQHGYKFVTVESLARDA